MNLRWMLVCNLALATFADAQWVRFEAESATLSGSAVATDDATASGGKFVAMGSTGRIDFKVTVAKTETYLLRLSNKGASASSRSFEDIAVNGSVVAGQHYAAGFLWDPAQTGHYTGEGELERFRAFKAGLTTYGNAADPWQVSGKWWEHSGGAKRNTMMAVALNAGTNTISVIKNWGGTKWDHLEIDTAYPSRALNVAFTIDPTREVAPISPMIYGTSVRFDVADDAVTHMRFGGNLTTPYNWENNYTNAGHDWYHSSSRIGWPTGIMPAGRQTEPGSVVTYHHDRALARGMSSLILLPMAGYVAADDKGVVTEAETAPSKRWKELRFKKNAPFSLVPDTTDGFVYVDEFVNFLVKKYGNASTATGVKNYALCNEPRLWSSTHPRIHPTAVTGAELIDRSTRLATAVKDVDPHAKLFGPAFYGIWPMYDLQNKPDWDTIKGSYSWFVDYYLDKMKVASDNYKSRLLDVFTFHYYSHTGSDSSDTYIRERMQAPRGLWDPDYTAMPLLKRVQNSIDKYNPGTKMGITEYGFGGRMHISGGIATADLLGIFARMGLHQASYWTLSEETPYPIAAFRLYRNYDGKRSTFGDTRILGETSDKTSTSLHASTFRASPGRLNLIVLNKELKKSVTGTFTIAGSTSFTSARVWGFDSTSPAITERASIQGIKGNTFTMTLPPLTAYHIVLQAGGTTGIGASDPARSPSTTGSVLSFAVSSLGEVPRADFELAAAGFVTIEVFDLSGKRATQVLASHLGSGRHSIDLDLAGAAIAGPMLVRLRTADGEVVRPLF